MLTEMFVIAAADTVLTRLAVLAVASIVGAILIFTGIQNVRTESAEESGKRRLVNKALGASNTYEGSKAVQIGWIRIVCGIGAIIFGVVFIFVGSFLANGGLDRNVNTISIVLSVCGGAVLIFCASFAFMKWKRKGARIDGVLCGKCGRVNSISTRVCPRCMTKT